MKKILALGNQEFSKVINNNCIYVDKTKYIYKLVTEGDYYFLSRPRRFGKSLLANTLKELFLANKELFKGLWIYDKMDWEKKYPVIKISFSNIDHEKLGLEKAIDIEISDIATKYGFVLQKKSIATKFKELIQKLAETAPVVIIIDEYDKPIIDYIGEAIDEETGKSKAEENRDILKNFYSILKDADKYIKFFFVTGVSKFSRVSIFSDLNNLTDISLTKSYSQIVGWTKEEVTNYFSDYIKEVAIEYQDIYPDIMEAITDWYNGYSWDGKTRLFNPVSLMNLFLKHDFQNYWFATGTPTFLIKYIKQKNVLPYEIENCIATTETMDKYEIDNITLIPLLFQTGYLTIKNYDRFNREYTLGYPNKEVARSFSAHFLSEHTTGKLDITENLLHKIRVSFVNNDMEILFEKINALFAPIPYSLVQKNEKYFHSLFYLVIRLLGFNIETEVLTIKGRIDAVVKTNAYIFIIEFKINQSAQVAIQQIKEKQYAEKFSNDSRTVFLVGINFDTENKTIDDYIIEKK